MVRAWAIAWYRPEDWERWLAICPDFAPEYDSWLARATNGLADAQAKGYMAEKVLIDPEEFLKWSGVNGSKVDGKARSQYAIVVLAAREGAGH